MYAKALGTLIYQATFLNEMGRLYLDNDFRILFLSFYYFYCCCCCFVFAVFVAVSGFVILGLLLYVLVEFVLVLCGYSKRCFVRLLGIPVIYCLWHIIPFYVIFNIWNLVIAFFIYLSWILSYYLLTVWIYTYIIFVI